MSKNEIKYLVGSEELVPMPLPVYSDIVCGFFDDLSRELREDREAKGYPDILTFAFWCRRGNIGKLKEAYKMAYPRVGKGLVFHIAPSNVPINFAFSLAFGMLAGNGNVVRVSNKDFPQTNIVCRAINRVFEKEEYAELKKQTQIISYGHDKEMNDFYSEKCDARVIWGGDAAIEEIRRSPMRARSTEITFADRYSFAVFDENVLENASDEEMEKLAQGFYNDTYLMDQNACSSPHLILWSNEEKWRERKDEEDKKGTNGSGGSGRQRFWDALARTAQKYDLPEKKALDKYTMLCEKAAEIEEIEGVRKYGNLLYVVRLSTLAQDINNLRGKFGLFYECGLGDIKEFGERITSRMQTCVTYGIDRQQLLHSFMENHVPGVDRIVPVGAAMDIGTYWDGYDVIGGLSRGIVL